MLCREGRVQQRVLTLRSDVTVTRQQDHYSGDKEISMTEEGRSDEGGDQ